jgi:predicted RNA-binding protein YlxR (DUF448 family)
VATRSCVVCRKSDEQGRLLRFVEELNPETEEAVDKNGVIDSNEVCLRIDLSGVEPGRGAYCHPTRSCFLDARLLPLLKASLARVKSAKIARRAKRDSKGYALLVELLDKTVARERDVRGRKWIQLDSVRKDKVSSSAVSKRFELANMPRAERVSVLLEQLRGLLDDSENQDSSPKRKILLRI